jgi:hypothetical protein
MEYLQAESIHIANDSLESTRRMVQHAQESNNIAGKTLEVLDQQGDQLRKIDEMLNNIEQTATKTSHDINKISRCCCCGCGHKPRLLPKNTIPLQDEIITIQPTSVRGITAVQTSARQPRHPAMSPQDNEIHENLTIVNITLEELKQKALNMGEELADHNKILDKITAKTSANTLMVDSNADKIAKLL